jgi:hypothetical protein
MLATLSRFIKSGDTLLYCGAAVSAYRTHRVPSPAAILIKSPEHSVPVSRTDQHDQGP